jgi:putative transposase
MTAYRRNFVAGGSYFFTVNLAERRMRLLSMGFAGAKPMLRG